MSLNYAYFSQARASSAENNATNSIDEASAVERVTKWTRTIDGMLSSSLDVGSRTPISNVPAFLTPEVLSGGYVSGQLSAGGPLLQFENFLVNVLINEGSVDAATINGVYKLDGLPPGKVDFSELSRLVAARGRLSKMSLAQKRSLLNRFFVSEYGFQVLCTVYARRNYHVEYPEEAALLTVAWLAQKGHYDQATRIIRTISPYFHLARFYPRPADSPVRLDLRASVSTSGEVRDVLKRMQASGPNNGALKICVMKTVIEKFNPAYDALLSAILATCTRIPDENARSVDAKALKADRLMLLPFQKITNAVRHALQSVVQRLKSIEDSLQSLMAPRKRHLTLSQQQKTVKRFNPKKTNSGFLYKLTWDFLQSAEKVVKDMRRLSFARAMLIQMKTTSKTGLPNKWSPDKDLSPLLTDSDAEYQCKVWTRLLQRFRQSQQAQIRHKEPSYISAEWASLLLSRVNAACGYDKHSAAQDVKPILTDARRDEIESYCFAIRVGESVPRQAVKLIRKLQLGSIDELIEGGIITSMETLADVSGSFLGAAQVMAPPPPSDPQGYCFEMQGNVLVEVPCQESVDYLSEGENSDASKPECNIEREEDAFRSLFVACNAAFRRRRSLLLLNYQSQVRISELPWALELEEEKERRTKGQQGKAARSVQRDLLVKLVKTCVSRWPHVLIPNKMVSALDAIARAAKMGSWSVDQELNETPEDRPTFETTDDEQEGEGSHGVSLNHWIGLTPELAADIFMGGFMPKWARHSRIAAHTQQQTLYDVYFRWKGDRALWNDVKTETDDPESAEDGAVRMVAECSEVAKSLWRKTFGSKELPWSSVAWNGVMIEWSMILTTHNYAYLFSILDKLGVGFSQDETHNIAVHGYKQLRSMLSSITGERKGNATQRAMLQTTKNVAYGWRQIVFLVSTLDRGHAESFFAKTVSSEQAAQGCHLQRALVDLKWVWKSLFEPDSVKGRRPWKAFRGWCFNGSHLIWDDQWCDNVKTQMESKRAEVIDIDDAAYSG